MDYVKILKADLEKGYSKSDLERLIGLPQNNLSGILKGDRKLSAKSKLKIEIWEKTVKPNPLELTFVAPTKESYDGKKVDKYVNDEYGQMGNSGGISRETWKHTNIKIAGILPKTLDELKALCPHPKGTDEFREWVRTERQKYNI